MPLLFHRILLGLGLCLLPVVVTAQSCADVQASEGVDHPSVHCSQAPGVTIDAKDRLWLSFVQDQLLYVSHSLDGGNSYAPAVQVTTRPEAIEVNGENRPKIIVDDPGHVYLSWTTKTAGNHTGDIRFSHSSDGGRTFSEPVTINDDGLLTSHRFESMLLTRSGHLYLVWLDKRDLEAARERGEDYEGSAVYYAVSADQGQSFSANHRVAAHSCECCRIAIAPYQDDGVAILWRQLFDGARDHAIALLNPDGEVLHSNRASHDDWQINACPHHGPALAVAGDPAQPDAYHMSWFTNSSSHQGIYYGRYALDQQETGHVFQVDGSAGAAHPQIAEFNGGTYLIWKRFDGRQTTVQLIRSADGGSTWGEPESVASTAASSDHPQLLRGRDGLYLGWHTGAEGFIFRQLSDHLQPFGSDSFSEIKQSYAQQPFVLALWSVDCPPCLVELDMLGRLKAEQPDLPLVLVSTDPLGQRDEAEDFLQDFGLDGVNSWMFADSFVERLRYSIDPDWYGELPRSYFFNRDHEAQAHSGTMTEAMLREWLKAHAH